MARYFDQVMETAGLYNTASTTTTRAPSASIPARHDVWRHASANWLAGLVVRGLIDQAEVAEMAPDMANGLADTSIGYERTRDWKSLADSTKAPQGLAESLCCQPVKSMHRVPEVTR